MVEASEEAEEEIEEALEEAVEEAVEVASADLEDHLLAMKIKQEKKELFLDLKELKKDFDFILKFYILKSNIVSHFL